MKVFYGDPLMKGIPSNKQAIAKIVEGAISLSQSLGVLRDFYKFSHVSLTPS
jgi:hypothetical protein